MLWANTAVRGPAQWCSGGMTEAKRALVLHLVGSAGPLHLAVTAETGSALATQLPALINGGAIHTITTIDGTAITVNFQHVATAHVGPLPQTAEVYGNTRPQR